MQHYTTVQGDTWDLIAKAMYGSEMKAQVLMEERENITLLDIEVFPAGIQVAVPDINNVDSSVDNTELPEWRLP